MHTAWLKQETVLYLFIHLLMYKNDEMQAVDGIKAGLYKAECGRVVANVLINERLSEEITQHGLNWSSLLWQANNWK